MPGAAKPKPASSAKGGGPSLRFRYPLALHKRILATLKAVEGAEDPTEHREALAEVVAALTERGLDAYFLEPLKAAEAGFMTQQSAKLGLSGVRQVMGPVIRNVIGRMDGAQLRSLCGSIRDFMG